MDAFYHSAFSPVERVIPEGRRFLFLAIVLMIVVANSISLQAQVNTPRIVISEFVANNNLGLEDADGDEEDWIEIYNAGATNSNLGGWFLTDDPNALDKWPFPSVGIAVHGYLLVFASGQNRTNIASELHTSFELSSESGFLALVRPELTIASSFNYPAQKADVSFGPSHTTLALVPSGSALKWHVPSNDFLGTNWTGGNEPFNDANWFDGNSGIGYIGTNLAFGSYSNLVRDDPGLVAYWRLGEVSGSSVADAKGIHNGVLSGGYLRNVPGALASGGDTNACTDFSGGRVTVPANAALNFAGGALTVEAWVQPDGAGNFAWLVAKENDNTNLDYLLGLNPDGRFRFITQGLAHDVAAPTVPILDGARWYHVVGVQDPVTNRVSLYVNGVLAASVARVVTGVTASNPLLIGDRSEGGQTVNGRIDEVAIYSRALTASEIMLHYQTGTNSSSSFGNLIGTNTQSAMKGINSSAYLRVPFEVANVGAMEALTLRLFYDDGFVAYVNGVEVARRNAPASLAWNSAATNSQSVSQVLQPETFDLTGFTGALHPGLNVLAIHGLNVSAADDDFLVLPELEASFFFADQPRFFAPPTPGTPNGQAYLGWVADTHFSVDRGFFGAAFDVAISCASSNATIRYTTNFTAPSETSGLIYTSPIHVAKTAALRAIAYFPGFIPSDVDTQTYLFTNDIIHQPANPPGFPTTWAGNASDYAMDQNVVNLAQTYSMHEALRSIPTLSIVTATDNIFGAANGIYVNSWQSGELWERPVSVEMINPDSTTAFQLDCGIRLQGGYSREPTYTPKHSFRLLFKSEYGDTKLRHPLFPDSTISRFDGLTLRAFYTDAWVANRLALDRFRPEDAQYQRDLWMKDSQLAMGRLAPHNIYCHLYINGLYWGLYNIAERPDASFNAAYRGGTKENYDIIKDYQEIQNGDRIAFDAMFAIANRSSGHARNVGNALGYADLEQYLDIPTLIDYMILHIYGSAEDWPSHNWYCGRLRAAGEQFKFYTWDQEIALDTLSRDRTGVSDDLTPARLYSRLRQNPEFRVRFGDHVQRHLFNNGALTPTNNIARYLARAAQIDKAVVAESARWGDVRRTPAFNRDGDWLGVQNWEVTNYFPNIHPITIQRFRTTGLYPNLGAPNFGQFGGAVTAGFALAMSHTNIGGAILFTLDGSDPRVPLTGAASSSAQTYTVPVAINSITQVRARVLSGGQWSALVGAVFYPPQDLSKLAVTEVMYNPPDIGATNGEEFEFLELKNTGTNVLNLSGLTFSAGIAFTFTNNTMLGPGLFFVLGRNGAAMAARYPGIALSGIFSGKLDNSGESIVLSHVLGGVVLSLDYDDEVPWPVTPDGFGFSLVPKLPGTSQAPDGGAKWRPSNQVGGSPGADDPAPGVSPVVINELLTHTDLPQLDSIELYNPTTTNADISGWFLTDDRSVPAKYRIPDGTVLSPGSHMFVNESEFNAVPGSIKSFSLGSAGDDVYLFSSTTNGQLTGYGHGVVFGAAFNGVSFGRYLDSTGGEHFPLQIGLSLGSVNPGPLVGPVIINEINYHPDVGGDEFIELLNITSTNVPLFSIAFPTNAWKLVGLDFVIPTNITLGPEQMLLLVATNPGAFRTKYNVPAAVQILGPVAGVLQNSGERLELQSPDTPNPTGIVPYVTTEEVRYNDKSPWPAGVNGTGFSLQRKSATTYGNDPVNWTAASLTPGQLYGGADSDGDGLPDVWEMGSGTNWKRSDADEDADGDDFTNLQEFLAGTNPQDANSLLKLLVTSTAEGMVVLEFMAASNHTYSVLYKSALDDNAWNKLTDVSAHPTNLLISITNSTSGSDAQFYRLLTPAQ